MTEDLKIITKTYDVLKWYIPQIQRLPRNWRFVLGERIENNLYDILDDLVSAKYTRDPLSILEKINIKLEKLRYQTRLLLDFGLINIKKFEYIIGLVNEVGKLLGGWIKTKKQI